MSTTGPADYNQGQMELFADNIKPDRTPEDPALPGNARPWYFALL